MLSVVGHMVLVVAGAALAIGIKGKEPICHGHGLIFIIKIKTGIKSYNVYSCRGTRFTDHEARAGLIFFLDEVST